MSAYIVSRGHIRYLVEAARRLSQDSPVDPGGRSSGIGSYYHNRTRFEVNDQTESRIGLMLWKENARSVMYRYDGGREESQPGPIDDGPRFGYSHALAWRLPIKPLEVLSAIACYEYQSCETEDWQQTEAAAFCDALRHHAIRCLPGYDSAPWGCPDGWDVQVASNVKPMRV